MKGDSVDKPEMKRDEYGALICSCCEFKVDHDGHRSSREEPGVDPNQFWCDLCDLVWSPEEVPA